MNKYLRESGYRQGLETIDIQNDIEEIISFLNRSNINYKKKNLFVSRRRIQDETRAFFSEYFSLHEVYVLPSARTCGFSGVIKATGDYNKAIREYCLKTTPFDIDLKPNYKDFHNYTEVESIYDESHHHLTQPYFKAIFLAAPYITTSPCTYAHEIGHTQLDSNYGCITNYHNKEVISIFLEKLFALKRGMSVFYDMERRRLNLLNMILNAKDVSPEKENEVVAYIISTLKAEQLFNIYVGADERVKAIIIEMIQDVFDNRITLEDLLQSLDITYESSLDTAYMERNLAL